VTKPKILVVDDEENIRHVLRLLLTKHGYTVTCAENGAEALLELDRRDFAAVFCDLRMPELDGMGVLQELRAKGTQAVVIVMSAYADIDDALAAIKAGAIDYVAKPFKNDEVLFTLRKALERQQLRDENESLKVQALGANSFAQIISRSQAFARVFETVRKAAEYKSTVLLSGESGTGKEMVARALHNESPRADGPFIAINCGAIPGALLESELFGHAKGAFTDAARDRNGLFLEASGGTLFLDEIGDMPTAIQVKLLRVLQEGEVRRLGETAPRSVDARVVAASVHDLGDLVKQGKFREDLYYRLNVLPIKLPSLRERREDIPLLVEHFVRRHNTVMNTSVTGISPMAMSVLTRHDWPGNVRELENLVERAMVLAGGEVIVVEDLPEELQNAPDAVGTILESGDLSIKRAARRMEKLLIGRALEETGGNRTAASKLLEISHRALLYKIKDYFPEGDV